MNSRLEMEFAADATSKVDGVAASPELAEQGAAQLIGKKLAPYNPTNLDAVHIALEMLELNSSDIFYDLGCGDGRLLVEVSYVPYISF